jgi:hypothetical protein
MLVVGGGLPEARGHQQITKAATQLWDLDRRYLAEPRRILQVRDTALVLADHAINVVHRGDDGCWRYAISLLDLEKTTATSSDDQPEHRSAAGQHSQGRPQADPSSKRWPQAPPSNHLSDGALALDLRDVAANLTSTASSAQSTLPVWARDTGRPPTCLLGGARVARGRPAPTRQLAGTPWRAGP